MADSPVVRLSDLKLTTQTHGAGFEARFAAVAAPLGAKRLGSRYVEIPAGRKGWPLHCHHANDELFVILSGRGTLRFGTETFPVAAGDVVVCPAGGPETAHQLIAADDAPLAYLAVSTMNEPDVMEYPDSGKLTVFAGAAPGGDKAARRVAITVRADSGVDYWDGEA
ncbi:cupin domain-containing protein [Jiella sonneratiae]|uniref:Cupin domain-containing protein n=1 Tax=Jiella sonneratiae TaxID=2816856 RepID=A0ABS3J819_9HYPH|nr:cupin domain-containing protein [Jiella sonneratiae]MBO0905257.1 cupin domain-containing protein [Jiella sonneratiae]